MNFMKDKLKQIGNVVSKTITSSKDPTSEKEEEQPNGNLSSKTPSKAVDLKGKHEKTTATNQEEPEEQDLLDFFELNHISFFDTTKLPARVRTKVESFQKILSCNKINMKKLKDQCFNGIPEDCPGLRSIVWRLVLGLIPNQKALWEKTMTESRDTYKMLANQYIYSVNSPSEEVWLQQEKDENEYYQDNTKEKCTQKEYANFFDDRDQWIEVEKDTTRTRSEMHFFVTETQRQDAFSNPYKRVQDQSVEKHFDVLSRILFVFAKANPGIKYVQGMNEILAVLYHVFLSDKQFAEHVEADSFFAFTIVMGEVRDCFIKVLDDSDSGIKARISQLNGLLRKVDEPLWQALEDMGLTPHFYSLRWLMLIFTQEFQIFDVMRLWDSYLSHANRQRFMDFICLSILTIQRDKIMFDFVDAMESLQRIQNLDVVEIVILADKLYKQHADVV